MKEIIWEILDRSEHQGRRVLTKDQTVGLLMKVFEERQKIGFAAEVEAELASAREQHPRPQASLHEGYAVLAEEVDEVWDIVKQKASRRDHKKLREELVQVAAMAQRMAEEASR